MANLPIQQMQGNFRYKPAKPDPFTEAVSAAISSYQNVLQMQQLKEQTALVKAQTENLETKTKLSVEEAQLKGMHQSAAQGLDAQIKFAKKLLGGDTKARAYGLKLLEDAQVQIENAPEQTRAGVLHFSKEYSSNMADTLQGIEEESPLEVAEREAKEAEPVRQALQDKMTEMAFEEKLTEAQESRIRPVMEKEFGTMDITGDVLEKRRTQNDLNRLQEELRILEAPEYLDTATKEFVKTYRETNEKYPGRTWKPDNPQHPDYLKNVRGVTRFGKIINANIKRDIEEKQAEIEAKQATLKKTEQRLEDMRKRKEELLKESMTAPEETKKSVKDSDTMTQIKKLATEKADKLDDEAKAFLEKLYETGANEEFLKTVLESFKNL